MLVGDQETFTNMHKAKQAEPRTYGWVLPWIGDWHLLEHTLDVMFRKWGGFGLYKLARACGCYDKKLEGKNYHKRHFAFVAMLEALWNACTSEVNHLPDEGPGLEGRAVSPGERLLRKLKIFLDGKKHKTSATV